MPSLFVAQIIPFSVFRRSLHSLLPKSVRKPEVHSRHRSSCQRNCRSSSSWESRTYSASQRKMTSVLCPQSTWICLFLSPCKNFLFWSGDTVLDTTAFGAGAHITYLFQSMECNDGCHRQLLLRILQFLLHMLLLVVLFKLVMWWCGTI